MRLKRCRCLYLFITILFLVVGQGNNNNATMTRNKRYLPLIFQNPAAITFITGFGVPVHNLNPELVTVGMVFKAQQFLPTTYAALRQQANHSIHKREGEVVYDNSRIIFYKALEELCNSLGHAGRICVSKMICEVAAMPFHYANGVLGEILHILFTPSSSLATMHIDKTFEQAEQNGRTKKKCADIYKACNESILERITNLF